jgi:hypothetical protein
MQCGLALPIPCWTDLKCMPIAQSYAFSFAFMTLVASETFRNACWQNTAQEIL